MSDIVGQISVTRAADIMFRTPHQICRHSTGCFCDRHATPSVGKKAETARDVLTEAPTFDRPTLRRVNRAESAEMTSRTSIVARECGY